LVWTGTVESLLIYALTSIQRRKSGEPHGQPFSGETTGLAFNIPFSIHATPGSYPYGDNVTYDYAPISWNLKVGQTQHFQFPTGNVVFYDPNLTPVPANPQGGFREVRRPVSYYQTTPLNYGDWDETALTWDVTGPTSTGGPVGSPGLDGVPGTADDQYPLFPYGAIFFTPRPAGAAASFVPAPTAVGSGTDAIGLDAMIVGSLKVTVTVAAAELDVQEGVTTRLVLLL